MKTKLENLDVPEYLFGLQRLIKDPRTPTLDRPILATHLNHIITDAKDYRWEQVREWSEEVFSGVHENTFTWQAEAKIDALRNSIAHVHAGKRYTSAEAASAALITTRAPVAQQAAVPQLLLQPQYLNQPFQQQQGASSNKYKLRPPRSATNRTDRPCEAFNSIAGCAKVDGHTEAGVQYGHHCTWCRQNLSSLHLHSFPACNIKKNPNHYLRLQNKFQA